MRTDVGELRLRAALESAPDAVAITDASGWVVELNGAASQVLGVDREAAIGASLEQLAADRGADRAELKVLTRALDGVAGGCQTRRTRDNGTVAHLTLSALPIRDSRGTVIGATVTLRGRSEHDARLAFIAEASQLLGGSLDPSLTLSTIGELVVPHWGDMCAIALYDSYHGLLRPAALRHADPVREGIAEEIFWANVFAPRTGSPLHGVVRGGPPVLIQDVESAISGLEPLGRRRIAQLDIASALIVPMKVRDELLGVVCVCTSKASRRRLDERDTALFTDLAERAAQAIDNARLFQAVQSAETRFRQAFEHAPIGIALLRVDAEGLPCLAEVNPAMCQISGRHRGHLIGMPLEDLVHPDDRLDEAHQLGYLVRGDADEVASECRHLRPDGETRWVFMRAAPLEDGAFVAQFQDITESRRAQEELEHLAGHDPLTGLLNRRRFEEELQLALADVRRHGDEAAVITLDIDNFKHVNDTYGHPVGDEVLQACSRALESRLRTTDRVARIGGDEFGLVLPRTSPAEAHAVASSLLEALRGVGVRVGERLVRVTASGGMRALTAGDERGAGDLLGEADMAMYDAKERGRDRLSVIRPGDLEPERVRARMRWSERIRDALAEDHFVLYEQPIMRIADRRSDRSELLLRMRGPDGEIHGPGHFLPIAEAYGMIQAIDRWVVRNAIELLSDRRVAGVDLAVEVNLSGDSLVDESVIDFIVAEINNAQIDPTRLVFEVTETAAIGNLERARHLACELSALGCGFALDDFGAGFSSFAYLKHLPLDVIKIDGEFVRNLAASRHDQVTIRAIVDMAKGLGKQTVAEFVEDEQTLRVLHDLGVDRAQGYYVGQPAPAQALPGFQRAA